MNRLLLLRLIQTPTTTIRKSSNLLPTQKSFLKSSNFSKNKKTSSSSSTSLVEVVKNTRTTTTAAESSRRGGPLSEYKRRIFKNEISEGDSSQLETVIELQNLFDRLLRCETQCRLDRYSTSNKSDRSRWLWSRFIPHHKIHNSNAVKGLYLHGGVGTGKTMLMDMFYHSLPPNWRKKRIHFHDFMITIHTGLQKHRGVEDPLEFVAGEISDESIVLCLDEFMVTDVADALILNRLFLHLFGNGVVLIATSNRAPEKLYENGLQRELFLPFISSLKERCVSHSIGSGLDYRRINEGEEEGVWLVGDKSKKITLMEKFERILDGEEGCSETFELGMGRRLRSELSGRGCVYFKFGEICEEAFGAGDYIRLFEKFHTLALEGVPLFGVENRPAGYRFVKLIDVMYERKRRLICTAEGDFKQIFEKIVTVEEALSMAPRTSSRSRRSDDLDICVDNELGFAKERTISRLIEMSGREYLENFRLENGLEKKSS